MEIITSYKSFDGKTFENKEECLRYENEWLGAYELLNTIKFYTEDGELVTIPKIQSFLKAGVSEWTREELEEVDNFFTTTHFIKFTDTTIFYEVRRAYEKFLELMGYMLDISSTTSVYGMYVYDDSNGFIPIDDKYEAAKREILMMDRIIDE